MLIRPLHLKKTSGQAWSPGCETDAAKSLCGVVRLSGGRSGERGNARLSVSFSLMQLHPDSGRNHLQARRQAQRRHTEQNIHFSVGCFPRKQNTVFKNVRPMSPSGNSAFSGNRIIFKYKLIFFFSD